MKRYRLVATDAEQEARRLLESGQGDVSSYEVIEAMLRMAEEGGEQVSFFRRDDDKDVEFDAREMGIAVRDFIEVRPRD